MPPRRAVSAFALRFALVLGVYLLPWSAVGVAYASGAAALGNAVIAGVLDGVHLEFARVTHGDTTMQSAFGVVLHAADVARGHAARLFLDLRTLTYVPTAVFVALAVATPMWEGKRGVRVLAAGLVLLHVFFAVTLASTVALSLSGPARLRDPGPSVPLGSAATLILQVIHRVFVAPPGMAAAVPVLVWLLVLHLVPDDAPATGTLAPANRQAGTALLRRETDVTVTGDSP